MSIEVMTWVGRQTVGSSSEKFVLLMIADHADADGGNAWPSIATLCARTELSRRTVQRCLRALEDAGWIAVDLQRGGNLDMADSDRPNLYRVVMEGRQDDAPRASPRRPGGRHSDARGGVMVSRRGRHGDAQTVLDPPREPSVVAPDKPAPREDVIAKGFYERYPLTKYLAVRQIIRQALKARYSEPDIVAALTRLGEAGRPVTSNTLLVELNGLKASAPTLRPSEYEHSPASSSLEQVLW